MLPYLAAAGHNQHTKSRDCIYRLEHTNPTLFKSLKKKLTRCEKIGQTMDRFIYRFGHRTRTDEKSENGNQID